MGRHYDKYRGKQIYNYVSLNYLNMSLAHKGELADRMFTSIRKERKAYVPIGIRPFTWIVY